MSDRDFFDSIELKCNVISNVSIGKYIYTHDFSDFDKKYSNIKLKLDLKFLFHYFTGRITYVTRVMITLRLSALINRFLCESNILMSSKKT